MIQKIVNVVVALLVIVTLYFTFVRGRGDVSGAEARRLVQAGALLLDVRTVEEFASGHIEGAVNIPVQQLDRRLSELPPPERAVVVYCHSGTRSRRAAELLRKTGRSEVHDLGPMSAW